MHCSFSAIGRISDQLLPDLTKALTSHKMIKTAAMLTRSGEIGLRLMLRFRNQNHITVEGLGDVGLKRSVG